MAIANQIAQFGMNAGQNIQGTVRNAMARSEDQRRYGQQQERLSRQDELQNKMMQTQAQALADEKERKYAANGYEVMSQLPPEKRSMAWQQWIQTGAQQGIDMAGVPTQYDDSLLQKLAFQGGSFKPKSSKLTNFRQTANNTMAGYNPATNSFEEIPSGGIRFKDPGNKTEVSITNEAQNKGMMKEQEVLAGVRVGRFENIQMAADNAIDQDEQLAQLENIDIDTGFGTEVRGTLASVVNAVLGDGIGDALTNTNLSALQAFKGVSARLVNSELNKAKGPQTEGDAQRAKSTLASLTNEVDANKFLVKSLRATNARRIEQAAFYESILERDGTLKDADKEWSAFKRKTPMLSSTVLDQGSGMPMFFNEFAAKAQAANPSASKEQIINAWRELNE